LLDRSAAEVGDQPGRCDQPHG